MKHCWGSRLLDCWSLLLFLWVAPGFTCPEWSLYLRSGTKHYFSRTWFQRKLLFPLCFCIYSRNTEINNWLRLHFLMGRGTSGLKFWVRSTCPSKISSSKTFEICGRDIYCSGIILMTATFPSPLGLGGSMRQGLGNGPELWRITSRPLGPLREGVWAYISLHWCTELETRGPRWCSFKKQFAWISELLFRVRVHIKWPKSQKALWGRQTNLCI